METNIRSIEGNHFVAFAVVKPDIEAARQWNEQLMQGPVGVTCPHGATGDIEEVVDSLDRERDMPSRLDETQVAARI